MNNYIHTEEIHNTNSAKVILPLVYEIIQPKSIIDIGCGIGTWLSVGKKLGVDEVLGVDGFYVDLKLLNKFLLKEEFLSYDLNLPLHLNRNFDLAICLEVAEHLSPESSDTLIDSLVRHSENILFSAAIMLQGGQNHLNEQSPQYWIEKFQQRGYFVYDPIRSIVWDMEEVDVWYKQNIFIFSKKKLNLPKPLFTHIVHPVLFEQYANKAIRLQLELERIKNSKVSPKFYLKRLFQSIFSK